MRDRFAGIWFRGLLGSEVFVDEWSIGHLGVEGSPAAGMGVGLGSEVCMGHDGGGRRDEDATGG